METYEKFKSWFFVVHSNASMDDLARELHNIKTMAELRIQELERNLTQHVADGLVTCQKCGTQDVETLYCYHCGHTYARR